MGDSQLLLVASDRVSAFDFLLQNTVRDKGKILTLITHFWLTKILPQHVPELRHHFISLAAPHQLSNPERELVKGRCTMVKKCTMFPLEVIVRGYITGTAWKEYCRAGTVHGLAQPEGLQRCQKIPNGPLYTPAIKAKYGGRDENISPARAAEMIGQEHADRIQRLALALYDIAYNYALERGIIIADTKFEFGLDLETNEILLADELLTPDCSRFWSAADYCVGQDQKSFDKQHLCDWMAIRGLDGTEGVIAPNQVIDKTRDNYHKILQQLTGWTLDEYLQSLPDVSA